MNSRELVELVAELASTPHFLTEALESVSPGHWDDRVSGIEFSLRQQFCHLRDVELEGYLVRVFRVAAEENPVLVDLDGTQMAHERRYAAQDAALAVHDFGVLRAMTMAKLRGLSPDAWKRKGRFDVDPEFDLHDLLAMMHSHDEQHCDEISALIAAALQSREK